MRKSMSTNRSMPPSVIIPVLPYRNVPEAAAWLCDKFGFQERLRIADHRVQLSFGDGSIVVTQAGGSAKARKEELSVMVRVADLNSHHARALERGARIVRDPADYPFGERQYTTEDLGGYIWTFSQSIADVDPASWGGTLVEDSVANGQG